MYNHGEVEFALIAKAGEARSYAFEALELAKLKEYDNAAELLKKAENLLLEAHQIQFKLLSKEAKGEGKQEVGILLVHAQDHLMTAILAKELIAENIQLRKELIK
ncbi:MAG: PTS lactose/cellobiose transporter subunit IIA [Anaerorhabdus sp.]|uniref:PTS lactose/cellobiose transporter subunit IIA n=1 Tax=Anaerorhabdus sp. TaxID=1872524 RepID=UPI002FC5DA87